MGMRVMQLGRGRLGCLGGRAARPATVDRRGAGAQFAHGAEDDAGPSKTTITFHDGSTGLNQSYLQSHFNLRHLHLVLFE
jgi:hypothetical protein